MPQVETYLRTLRRHLRGLGAEEANEIIEELRSHITDKTAAGVTLDSILQSLGTPEALASRYVADLTLARAEVSRTPIGVLDGLFRWATLSGFGSFVLLASLIGYFIGATLMLVAILKPFHPHTAGLWTFREAAGASDISLRLGFGTPPPA